MAKQSRALDERLFVAPKRKAIPHAFVLDAIAEALPVTRPMFGCTAVYVKEKIVLVLRDKPSAPDDNGVWLATTAEHHARLRPRIPQHAETCELVLRATLESGKLQPRSETFYSWSRPSVSSIRVPHGSVRNAKARFNCAFFR